MPKRAKPLGQYFTPEPVVDLCFRLLKILDPKPNPRIIDPSCGEGAFLRYSAQQEISPLGNIYGIEKDSEVARRLADIGLAKSNIQVADGLLRNGKFLDESFDWAVGNPPFGTGLLTKEHAEGLKDFRFSRHAKNVEKYPIEILFLERFLQLAKHRGLAAIIIPDGILANERLGYVREWLNSNAQVLAVISLPQNIFLPMGAFSKSSILVFRKYKANTTNIFMASLESQSLHPKSAEKLANLFAENIQHKILDHKICASWDAFSIMPENPDDRLDPAYYHPKFMENEQFLLGLPNVKRLGDFVEYTTYGQVGRREYAESGIRYITPANLKINEEGQVFALDLRSPQRFVAEGSWNDQPRSRLRKGDLIFANSGVGCIGRAAVFMSDKPCNISQHINLLRVKGIEPEYLAVFLQTKFARLQIMRQKCGVGACGINFDRIKSLKVPKLPQEFRSEIAQEFLYILANQNEAELRITDLVKRFELKLQCCGKEIILSQR